MLCVKWIVKLGWTWLWCKIFLSLISIYEDHSHDSVMIWCLQCWRKREEDVLLLWFRTTQCFYDLFCFIGKENLTRLYVFYVRVFHFVHWLRIPMIFYAVMIPSLGHPPRTSVEISVNLIMHGTWEYSFKIFFHEQARICSYAPRHLDFPTTHHAKFWYDKNLESFIPATLFFFQN